MSTFPGAGRAVRQGNIYLFIETFKSQRSYLRKDRKLFLLSGPLSASFNTVDNKQVNKCSIQILPMTGFNPRTSGIGSDHSTNWVTITSLRHRMFVWTAREKISQSPSIIIIILSLLLSYVMWFEQLNSATYLLQNWKWIRWWK